MQNYVTNYEDAVELVYRIPRFNSNHSLKKIKDFLTRMGQPDRQMKIVHIAGTNGKGSTSAYLAGLLEASGLKVGLFTSPHLWDIRERFRINGEMISKELFLEAVQEITILLEEKDGNKAESCDDYTPCFFDMLFFIGMYAFCKEQTDIVVLETGLGGRLDATNAVSDKALTLITHIALDHTEYLGDTLEAIAEEKAGIMRAGVPCIVAAHNEEVAHVFLKKATELGCVCRIMGKEDYACQRVYEKSVAFSYFSSYYGTVGIMLNTSALYQADNAGLALASLEKLIESGVVPVSAFSVKKIQKTLYNISWAGRMEEVLPGVFLDGAHNPDGIRACLESIREDGCKGERILLFSAVSDKDYGQMLQDIMDAKLFGQVAVTEIKGERGVPAEVLAGCIGTSECVCIPDSVKALKYVLTKQKYSDYIYIVGSLYLVGQMKELLRSGKENGYDSV